MSISGSVTAQESQQQFLQLLVTQVQHQDPLDPMDQQDFIQQLAQFSELEGIENLNAKFSDMLALQQITNGVDLVGKSVRYVDGDMTMVGTVEEVATVDNRLTVLVNGKQMPIDSILAVTNGA